jgi:hypothetical protein
MFSLHCSPAISNFQYIDASDRVTGSRRSPHPSFFLSSGPPCSCVRAPTHISPTHRWSIAHKEPGVAPPPSRLHLGRLLHAELQLSAPLSQSPIEPGDLYRTTPHGEPCGSTITPTRLFINHSNRIGSQKLSAEDRSTAEKVWTRIFWRSERVLGEFT